MNLIPVYSWHRAQSPSGVRFRIDSVAIVECCSCDLGMWMLTQRVVMKECCVASSLWLSAKKPPGSIVECHRYYSLSD